MSSDFDIGVLILLHVLIISNRPPELKPQRLQSKMVNYESFFLYSEPCFLLKMQEDCGLHLSKHLQLQYHEVGANLSCYRTQIAAKFRKIFFKTLRQKNILQQMILDSAPLLFNPFLAFK